MCSTGLRGAGQTGLWETSCIQDKHKSVTFAVVQKDSSLRSVTYRRTEFIWSTVIRERGWAELSRVRRQLSACLATYRPAAEGRHFGEIQREIKYNGKITFLL